MGKTSLSERIYAAMMCGAIGDAMGFPNEGLHYKELGKRYGWQADFRCRQDDPPIKDPTPVLGSYTDDTVMKFMLCEAVFRGGGYPTPGLMLQVWAEWYHKRPLSWHWWNNTRVVMAKAAYLDYIWRSSGARAPISEMHIDPREVGRDSVTCNDAAMIMAPVGCLNPGDPSRAALEAWDLSSFMQRGYSRECAAAAAAAFAAALRPEASIDDVIAAITGQGEITKREYSAAAELALKCSDGEEFIARWYEELLKPIGVWSQGKDDGNGINSFNADPLEVIGQALGILIVERGSPRGCAITGANFGRDCDTIAGVAAGLAGALNGMGDTPPAWPELIQAANPEWDIREVSMHLARCTETRMETIRRQLADYDRLT